MLPTSAAVAAASPVICAAFALRLYGIGRPMWFDEIWSYRLAQLGLGAIFENGRIDQWPPLYYLIQYLSSGFGMNRSEIAFRWVGMLCGTLAVPVMWRLTSNMTSRMGAMLCSLLVATSPVLIYYSQEARPYAFLMLLSALSIWLSSQMLDKVPDHRMWAAWLLLSLLGLYSGYAYLMIIVAQVAIMSLIYHRKPIFWLVCGALAIGALPLIPIALSSFRIKAAEVAGIQSLSLWFTIQALLAGDPNRYGFSQAHYAAPWLFLPLLLAGVAYGINARNWKFQVYLVVQITLPLVLYFGLVEPVLRIRLPSYESRQFALLLAALFVLVGQGFAWLYSDLGHLAKAGRGLAIGLCLIILLLNAIGLRQYWIVPKSPEALAVISVRSQMMPDDRVVSLHYSLNFAAGFYLPSGTIYVDPRKDSSGYVYTRVDPSRFFAEQLLAGNHETVADIRQNTRFWVLYHATALREPLNSLIAGCQVISRETFSPFEAALVESCPP
jgi:Dolichyl-phosphate-mannose-protein mannosyltransferase